MPNTVVHEEVGYYLSKKLDTSSYEYYLGLMAPDAVNVEHFANKQERWTSHVRDKDLNIWKENLKKFYKEEKNKINNDFLLGYTIHILTDIVYDEYFEEKIHKEILKNNQEKDYWYIKWSDMDKYSFKEQSTINTILLKNNNYNKRKTIKMERKIFKKSIKFKQKSLL